MKRGSRGFETLLRRSTKDGLGFPVVFLSGYDSTAVTALLQANRTQPLKTFTIGFEGKLNEDHTRVRSAHLGTDHHELVVQKRKPSDYSSTPRHLRRTIRRQLVHPDCVE